METDIMTQPRLPIFSGLEREVIRLGIRDGEQARRRFHLSGLLSLGGYSGGPPLSSPALEALRSWAEMACAMRPSGRDAPTTILTDAGYSLAQISEARRLVAASAATDEEHKP